MFCTPDFDIKFFKSSDRVGRSRSRSEAASVLDTS